jgi:hypothetical protein
MYTLDVTKGKYFMWLNMTFEQKTGLLVLEYKYMSEKITYIYFYIFACLVIFFYFLQSDWLQQRAAFYDILTVVQKCYFLATNLFTKCYLNF